MHTREERKRDWMNILAGEGDRGAERSPGALDPARRDSWSDMECRLVKSWGEKGKIT